MEFIRTVLVYLLLTTTLTLADSWEDPPLLSSDNYVPRSRPDFNLADIPCDLKENNACTRAGKAYPWYGIQNFIVDNRAMIKRLYGAENQRGPTSRAQGPIMHRRDGRVLQATNACPSEQFVITPFWANNSDGTTLALVNFHPFEQAIQQEICKTGVQGRCRDGCQCEQKHAWYRLLAFDPRNECKGIFMDWFQFPSCCACNCYDPGPHDATPASSTVPSLNLDVKPDVISLTPKLFNMSVTAKNSSDDSSSSDESATTSSPLTTESSTVLTAPTTTSSSTTASSKSSSPPVSSSSITNITGPLARSSALSLDTFLGTPVNVNDSITVTTTTTTNSPTRLGGGDTGANSSLTSTVHAAGDASTGRPRNLAISPAKTLATLSTVGPTGTTVVTSSAGTLPSTTVASWSDVASSSTGLEEPSRSSSSTTAGPTWYDNVLPTIDQDQIESVMKVVDVAIRRNRIPRI